jgi:3-deoxy-D-manno-octulosonic-acid transferase
VVSTTSLAGRELAAGLPETDVALLLPLDVAPCISRALATIRPAAFVFTETEIWPNLLRELARRGVPAILLSGRISQRAFARYRWVRPFLHRVLSQVAFFGMQSEADAERIRALGAPAERVRVTGSLKLDMTSPPSELHLEGDGLLWVVGSTHAGEEDICVRIFDRLRRRFPDLRLLLAPRHLARCEEVARLLGRMGVRFVRRSRVNGVWRGDPPVLLLDTLGELPGLYAYADLAFVGGTLVPVGGHNLLEPARAGVPVLFGPHVENVSEIARRLEDAGGARRVRREEELEVEVTRVLAEGELRARMGQAARDTFPTGTVARQSLEAAIAYLPEP